MDKKLYNTISKLINDIMVKESPQWSKNRGVVLDKKRSFLESLEVDSLLALQIVSKIEKKFGIQLKEEEFVYFDSMENIVNLIDRKIQAKSNKSLPLAKNSQIKNKKDKIPGNRPLKVNAQKPKKSPKIFAQKNK